MSPFRRQLYNLLSWVSMPLCMAMAVVWVCSYSASVSLMWTGEKLQMSAAVSRGAVYCSVFASETSLNQPKGWRPSHVRPPLDYEKIFNQHGDPAWNGFGFHRARDPYWPYWSQSEVLLPCWLLCLLFVVLPMMQINRELGEWRRTRRGTLSAGEPTSALELNVGSQSVRAIGNTGDEPDDLTREFLRRLRAMEDRSDPLPFKHSLMPAVAPDINSPGPIFGDDATHPQAGALTQTPARIAPPASDVNPGSAVLAEEVSPQMQIAEAGDAAADIPVGEATDPMAAAEDASAALTTTVAGTDYDAQNPTPGASVAEAGTAEGAEDSESAAPSLDHSSDVFWSDLEQFVAVQVIRVDGTDPGAPAGAITEQYTLPMAIPSQAAPPEVTSSPQAIVGERDEIHSDPTGDAVPPIGQESTKVTDDHGDAPAPVKAATSGVTATGDEDDRGFDWDMRREELQTAKAERRRELCKILGLPDPGIKAFETPTGRSRGGDLGGEDSQTRQTKVEKRKLWRKLAVPDLAIKAFEAAMKHLRR